MLVELDDESGEELLLLLGELLLLPLLEPEAGYSEPPVAELGLTPKYEKTLCRQLGCEISALASNVGADCNLLVSPLKVKVGPIAPVVEVEEVAPALLDPELDGRNKLHGTAICFPELDVPEVSAVVVVEALEDEVLEAEPAELLSERMAKSTFPEPGLMTTS